MIASVYVNPMKRIGLIDDNVTIVSISPLPKLKKNGEMAQLRGYMPPPEGYNIRNLYEKGIRVADVIYSDGTPDWRVWINMKDIKE